MKSRGSLLLALIVGWLVFVVSLTIWWMIFSLKLIDKLNQFVQDPQFIGNQQMLLMEGAVLIFFLLMGGGGLIYYSLREQKRLEDVRHFFSTFSHDIKTSITRLVLQAENFTSGSDFNSRKLDQFQKNLLQLELQLENSMHIAQYQNRGIQLLEVDLKQIIARIHPAWPEVKIQLQGEPRIRSDASVIESILKNLLSNSVLHGGADEVQIHNTFDKGSSLLKYTDNGKIINENIEFLGRELSPSKKGSGIGLYLVCQWVKKLGGRVQFSQTQQSSLQVQMTLPQVGK